MSKTNVKSHPRKTTSGRTSVKRHSRSKGKITRNATYVHKSNEEIIPRLFLINAKNVLKKEDPDYEYDVIKYNRINKNISFIKAPDFYKTKHPEVHESFVVRPDGSSRKIRYNVNRPIYHKTELF